MFLTIFTGAMAARVRQFACAGKSGVELCGAAF
jgi:hypothetical protein